MQSGGSDDLWTSVCFDFAIQAYQQAVLSYTSREVVSSNEFLDSHLLEEALVQVRKLGLLPNITEILSA